MELPPWVGMVGYTQVSFRIPRHGEYFYDPVQGKVLRCYVEEFLQYAILEYESPMQLASNKQLSRLF